MEEQPQKKLVVLCCVLFLLPVVPVYIWKGTNTALYFYFSSNLEHFYLGILLLFKREWEKDRKCKSYLNRFFLLQLNHSLKKSYKIFVYAANYSSYEERNLEYQNYFYRAVRMLWQLTSRENTKSNPKL